MKPHRFDYHAPESLEGATSLFDQYGDDAKALAGGQSLMPLVNMRLAQPEVIVDLNRVASMAYVEESPHGGLRVGAMTRVRTLERLSGLRDTAPLLFAAIPHIGHFQIRNRRRRRRQHRPRRPRRRASRRRRRARRGTRGRRHGGSARSRGGGFLRDLLHDSAGAHRAIDGSPVPSVAKRSGMGLRGARDPSRRLCPGGGVRGDRKGPERPL